MCTLFLFLLRNVLPSIPLYVFIFFSYYFHTHYATMTFTTTSLIAPNLQPTINYTQKYILHSIFLSCFNVCITCFFFCINAFTTFSLQLIVCVCSLTSLLGFLLACLLACVTVVCVCILWVFL